MKFEKMYEARDWFRQYKPFKYQDNLKEYDGNYLKFGDWILFQNIRQKRDNYKEHEISRPIFGLFVGFSIWDMALVVNIVEKDRAWIFHNYLLGNPETNHYNRIGFYDPETESFPIWDDNIYELSHWESKPNFKQ